MPHSKKDKKSENIGKYYKPKKRKVISPIQVSENKSLSTSSSSNNRPNKKNTKSVNGQTIKEVGRTTSISPEISQEPKRFHQELPSYFNFQPYVSTDLTNMSMNFPQMPFGQVMQSPPAFNQSFPVSSAGVASGTAPPQWATQMMEDIKSIKQSVSKIDQIEKFVNKISVKVDTLEIKVNTMDTKVKDVEKSTDFVSKQFEDSKTKLKSADDSIKQLNNKCKDFETKMKDLETKNKNLEAKADDLEARGLRENLLFHGINENVGENCETLVKDFIRGKLEILQEVTIDRAHRLGKPKGRVRPIVVKFHYYTEREQVRLTAQDKTNELKALNQGVGIQQTKTVLQKRRDLSAVYDREKAAGRSVKWAGARLMVRDGDVGNFHEVTE